MTTKLTIHNDTCSNGDVHVNVEATYADGDEMVTRQVQPEQVLTPGRLIEMWLSTSQKVTVHETWPTEKPASDISKHGDMADALIGAEVATQDKMWGDANERADSMNGQLLDAALAQAHAVFGCAKMPMIERTVVFDDAKAMFYPKDWSGFRDYGSDIANLVVAAAYIRNEIKRRLVKGESYHRSARTAPYTGDQPAMSAVQAADPNIVGSTHTGKLGSPVITINEHAHGNQLTYDSPRYPPGDARNDTL